MTDGPTGEHGAAGVDAGKGADAGENAAGSDDEPYSGVVGAFPYAFRATPSLGMKLYVLVSLLVSAVVGLIFALALVTLVSGTAGTPGGTFTFSRAFFVLLMLGVVGPLVAPVLLVARRHRRTGSTRRYDAAVALAGYAFVAAVYVGLVISTPAQQQTATDGVFGPALAALYALPRLAGFGPPLLAVGLLWVVHRRFGRSPAGASDREAAE